MSSGNCQYLHGGKNNIVNIEMHKLGTNFFTIIMHNQVEI